jgi:ADP-heptose:LPS heptosyltransferase
MEPEWDGSKGKTVIVQCDQGVGDILMFSQLLPRLQKDCKQVICDTVPRLVPLLERNFPGIVFYGTLKQRELSWLDKHEIDAHIHLSYLPKFYLNKDSDFERKAYLTPNVEIVEQWRKDLEKYPKPWVGITWHGGIQNTQKHLRSMDLAELAPVIEKAGTTFDLSYHDSNLEVARWNIANKSQVIKLQVEKDNFEATVALIALMDEVVTVTTTVAHVCGAMGKKAKVLVNETPQWRYSYRYKDGKELIWYPSNSVQLFRRKPGETDWSPTIKRLANTLP